MKASVTIRLALLALTFGLNQPLGRSQVLLSDDFNYPDGSLESVSAGTWRYNGGTSGAISVQSGHALLSESANGDINSLLAGAPILVSSPAILFSSFSATFTALPSGAGDYFAHFGDLGSNFRAPVFASTNGAAPGKFRLGITRGAVGVGQATFLPTDFSLNTAYTVVTSYSLAGGYTTFWVNPTSQADAHVNPNDPTSSVAIWVYALLDAGNGPNGMGTVLVDDLRVGRTFGDVVDFPLRLILNGRTDAAFDMSFQTLKDRYYRIEISDDVSPPNWTTLYDNIYGSGTMQFLRITTGDGNRFYRLVLLP